MLNRGRLIFAVIAAIIAAAIVWALVPRPVAVETVSVARGSLTETIEEDGKTRVRERYLVAAPLAGTMERIALKAGDEVEAGSLITNIVPNPPALLDVRTESELNERLGAAEADLAAAQAGLARATAGRDQASIDLERARTLVEKGVASKTRLEQAELEMKLRVRELEAAQSQAHAAEHGVEVAKAALLRVHQPPSAAADEKAAAFEIRSPVKGRILRLIQESEGAVSVGTPLVEIGDVSDLEIVADLLTSDAVRVPAKAPVAITGWGGEMPLKGRVRLVEPGGFMKISALGVEEQRVNVVIDIFSDRNEWRSIGDGFRVDAAIEVATADNVLKVPEGAVFREGGGWAVFVVSDGRAAKRSIKVGRRGSGWVEIEEGLAVGDRVILYPGDRVSDGARVEPAA